MVDAKRKVAIYARVSTEHEAQLSALDNQVQYYDNLLQLHPEWELYEKYVDEGITGTSTKKRKNFMRMMDDASKGCFDLIVTREVSRFARNTVDTLQETRKLKKIGVEVYFTEDNIWTMNDEDGELRLTIMATLAQNESKKTSMRVKAGQMVSFQNAVPYGNGNILGYDRVGKEFVINPEQAETVRIIFDLYLKGYGSRYLADELERLGRKTSTGLTRWAPQTVSRILRNPFYCGTIVYRKEYVPDYLEQKKIKNNGEAEQVIVEGKHEPIISKETFSKAEKIRQSNQSKSKSGITHGHRKAGSLWTRKLKCQCGHNFNRMSWNSRKGENKQYAYQCFSQRKTGTIASRQKKGLSIEGICPVNMVNEWKLKAMANAVFSTMWSDKEGVLIIANDLLEKSFAAEPDSDYVVEIQNIKRKIQDIKNKQDGLLELRLDGEITKDMFQEKSRSYDEEILKLTEELKRVKHLSNYQGDVIEEKIKALKEAMEINFDFIHHEVPESIIDTFVDEIIVQENNRFSWKLNIGDASLDYLIDTTNSLKGFKCDICEEESPNILNDDTGCYRRVTSVSETSCFLGTFEISKDFMRQSSKIYHKKNGFRFPEKLVIKLFLV